MILGLFSHPLFWFLRAGVPTRSGGFSLQETAIAEDPEAVVRILMIGSSGVGKSTLCQRFGPSLHAQTPKVTIGTELHRLFMRLPDGKLVKVVLLDTMGSDSNFKIVDSFFRDADAFLLTFDVSNLSTWMTLDRWRASALEAGKRRTDRALFCPFAIANKIDLAEKDPSCLRVTREEVQRFEEAAHLKCIECSAVEMDASHIRRIISDVVMSVIDRREAAHRRASSNLENGQSSEDEWSPSQLQYSYELTLRDYPHLRESVRFTDSLDAVVGSSTSPQQTKSRKCC